MKNQFETRCNQLFEIGLKFDFDRNGDGGNYIYHGGINVHWTEITCMTDDNWNKTILSITSVKEKVDNNLQEIIQKSKTNKTLPLLNDNENPIDLVIDKMGVSYTNSQGKEIICQPKALWIDKLPVPCDIPYESILSMAYNYYYKVPN